MKTNILSSWAKAASIETKQIGWDLALFLALATAFFFWSVSGGKKKLVITILAIYILSALFSFIPLSVLTALRSPEEIFIIRAIVFLLILVFLVLFLSRAFKSYSDSKSIWWQGLILALLSGGFLLASLLNLAPPQVIETNSLGLSAPVLKFFTEPLFSRWWIILPIFGVLFI